ncbi:hypothetical protein MJO28_011529 [Puccinia striiformis f. sp. tritici]|uniref:Uncharacterized protein n=2 Tax=Puccinia striiformis f. sp. tritici TaxID=168172 RepID=A0ACC0E3M9_9BASI|nr:hypothetical protein MJO28_011524 [Puccinia striiformis f. sp. tritici]KAI7944001.1 hypothetical protein MJO28_011529 [Puccinia striiformis f. sp. tritici]
MTSAVPSWAFCLVLRPNPDQTQTRGRIGAEQRTHTPPAVKTLSDEHTTLEFSSLRTLSNTNVHEDDTEILASPTEKFK